MGCSSRGPRDRHPRARLVVGAGCSEADDPHSNPHKRRPCRLTGHADDLIARKANRPRQVQLHRAPFAREGDDDDHSPRPSVRGVTATASVVIRESETDVRRQSRVVPTAVGLASEDVDELLGRRHGCALCKSVTDRLPNRSAAMSGSAERSEQILTESGRSGCARIETVHLRG